MFATLLVSLLPALRAASASPRTALSEIGVNVLITLIVGMAAAFVSGLLAIAFLLRWLQNHPLDIFVWYRIGLAALIFVALFTGRV